MSPDGLEDMGPQTDGLHALTRRNCSDGKWSPLRSTFDQIEKMGIKGRMVGVGEKFHFLVKPSYFHKQAMN